MGFKIGYSPHNVSKSDILRLWQYLPDHHRRFAQTMYYLCARFVDVKRLRVVDVDFEARVIRFRRQKNGTMNESYPMPPELISVLREQIGRRKLGRVFKGMHSPEVAYSTFASAIAKARHKAGLSEGIYLKSKGRKYRRLTGHAMKAKRVQDLLMAGLSELEVQSLSHHKNRLSLLRYFGNPMENLDLKVKALQKL